MRCAGCDKFQAKADAALEVTDVDMLLRLDPGLAAISQRYAEGVRVARRSISPPWGSVNPISSGPRTY